MILAKHSTLTWINYGGGIFKVTASIAPAAQGVAPLNIVSAHGQHGKVQLAPGTYVLRVTSVAAWAIKVTP